MWALFLHFLGDVLTSIFVLAMGILANQFPVEDHHWYFSLHDTPWNFMSYCVLTLKQTNCNFWHFTLNGFKFCGLNHCHTGYFPSLLLSTFNRIGTGWGFDILECNLHLYWQIGWSISIQLLRRYLQLSSLQLHGLLLQQVAEFCFNFPHIIWTLLGKCYPQHFVSVCIGCTNRVQVLLCITSNHICSPLFFCHSLKKEIQQSLPPIVDIHEAHFWQLVDGLIICTMHLKLSGEQQWNEVRSLTKLRPFTSCYILVSYFHLLLNQTYGMEGRRLG